MNYEKYNFRKIELLKYCFFYLMLFLLIGKLFYNSYPAGFAGCILLPFLLKRKKKSMIEIRKQRLLLQFKDLILSFSGSLKAGYSIENAFNEAYKDLQFMYDVDADILFECKLIQRQMQNNIVLENLLQEFACRSNIADIKDFAEIFMIAKHSGGNLNKIIQNTVSMISEKIEIKEEIQILLASKRLEQNIMNVIPFAIMCYISFASPGYFEPLYANITGVFIMSFCLILYLFAFALSQKIMQIEV